MGVVWVADQTAPVQRRIALKVIKSADDSRHLLARFEQERQALALMDHPHIAKVLDAGVSDDGRPYFVMDLIKGVPLTKYCDEAKLTPKERLELFVPVCQAVQHAHQKGIIHRDLKPSNILVGLYDGRPVPKVIDFGVAKATGPRLGDQSIYTEVGAMIGTLEYMSPEQAELNNLDIDTRSDIYALGVILYELLTGDVPFSRKELRSAGFAEMLRIIKEVEPPKPSMRLSGSGTLPSVAACRHTEPGKLTRLVRGELDWIVMKCLEKDRSRRYETANGLSMDIQRYLADEPVVAGPPSATYRMRKFVRRNKPQVIAASLVLLALLAGIVGTSLGLLAAGIAWKAEKEQSDIAQARAREALLEKNQAERNEREALKQKQIAEAMETFLRHDLLLQADPTDQANRLLTLGDERFSSMENPTIKELLDRAAAELTPGKIERKFPNQPLVQAKILQTVASAYRGVGDFSKAIAHLERARLLYETMLGIDHPDTLACMQYLVAAYKDAGKLDLSLPLAVETLKLRKAKLGPEHPNTLNSMNSLAESYRATGKLDMAVRLFEETLRLRKATLGPEHLDTLISMNNLAVAYNATGKRELALPLFEETPKLMKAALGPSHPSTLHSMDNLVVAYLTIGRVAQAIPLAEKMLELRTAKLGPEHPDTLTSMNNLACAYKNAGKLDQALPLFAQTLKLCKAKLGPEHPHTLSSMHNLALAYATAGQWDVALQMLEETLKLEKDKLEQDHPVTLATMHNLAMAYGAVGKKDLALPLFEVTLNLRKAKLGPDHPDTLHSMHELAWTHKAVGNLDLALPLFEEVLKLQKDKLGPDHPDTLTSMGNLGGAYCKANQGGKATTILKEFIAAHRKQSQPNSPAFAGLIAQVSMDLLNCKQYTVAEEMLRECLAVREKTQADAWTTFNTKSLLGGALLGQKKYTDAEPLLLAGYKGMKQREKTIPPPAKIRLPEAINRLIELYTATNKPDELKKWQAERAKYPEGVAMPQEEK
jgi:eukaryotic-like serine/threonine-protein kinase